ncbi:MAG TPA: RiPP maturation radical SAM C-methyltransferase [Candidatus Elarobacter sp.]|jgi:magnesium-protoporphyrin IX monomethyl ester (oxidative) cyclase|nr:RiPP maturation radical SAM C-methyltransferase [Candidatus Elarobacter sp.]
MYRVLLLNLPFADVNLPSIALTQLKYVTEQAHPNAVDVRVVNLNHEFARYFGLENYDEVALGFQHHPSGLGDWIFRRAAFPDVRDNAEEYFRRYYPRAAAGARVTRDVILEKRSGIEDFFLRMIAEYGAAEADLVGLTSMFSQNLACFAFARILKTVNPGVCVAIGGANCENPMGLEIVEHVEAVDVVFSGPSLVSFPRFVGSRLGGDDEPFPAIAGAFSKRDRRQREGGSGSTAVATASPVAVIGEELDINVRIPLDYDDFIASYERFFPGSASGPSLTFETSRGCWWGEKSHCTFCGLNGLSMNYRAMAPALALEQFASLFAYAPHVSRYQCVDNILPRNYLKDVLPQLHPPENASIFYEVKADLAEADVRTLAGAKVDTIQPGIEALASSTLKLMRKGTTAFQNIALLKHCVAYAVRPQWNLLVGFPGEHEDVFAKYARDLPLLVHLEPPSGVFPVRFDRFSPYFNEAAAYGLELEPYDFYAMTYPFPEDSLGRLAFYFMDKNYEAEYFVEMVGWLGQLRAQVAAWNGRWQHGFDERPRLELAASGGRTVVVDTRGAQRAEHALTDSGLAILKHLKTQSARERLASAFPEIPRDVLEREIGNLREAGLVFEEADRLMSLVLDAPSTTG